MGEAHEVREAIEALEKDFLDGIPKPTRPMAPFLWAGGKGMLAKWIIQYIPSGRIYVEPYVGAASVFWHLPTQFPVEVLNDLDGDIVNLYRVMQDKSKFEELVHRLIFTPYARAESVRARQIASNPNASDIDRAWAFYVRQNQGFSGDPNSWGVVLYKTINNMADTTCRWRSRLKLLRLWHERLSRVQIDCIDGIKCIQFWDTPDTVFYIDPPYVLDTRKDRRMYKYEPDLAYHERLVEVILAAKGKVMLSCYDHPVYSPLTKAGWYKLSKETVAQAVGRTRVNKILGDGSAKARVPRTETLYLNFTPHGVNADLLGDE